MKTKVPPNTIDFSDVYIVTNLMESDLDRIITSLKGGVRPKRRKRRRVESLSRERSRLSLAFSRARARGPRSKETSFESSVFLPFSLSLPRTHTHTHTHTPRRQTLTNQHHQYFLYQILRGLKYIHSALFAASAYQDARRSRRPFQMSHAGERAAQRPQALESVGELELRPGDLRFRANQRRLVPASRVAALSL